jgi:hypothetical protein
MQVGQQTPLIPASALWRAPAPPWKRVQLRGQLGDLCLRRSGWVWGSEGALIGTRQLKKDRFVEIDGATRGVDWDLVERVRPTRRAERLCRRHGYADRWRVVPGGGRAGGLGLSA